MDSKEAQDKIAEYKDKKAAVDREITVLEVGIETSEKKLSEIKELLVESYPNVEDMDIDAELEKLESALLVLEKEYKEVENDEI